MIISMGKKITMKIFNNYKRTLGYSTVKNKTTIDNTNPNLWEKEMDEKRKIVVLDLLLRPERVYWMVVLKVNSQISWAIDVAEIKRVWVCGCVLCCFLGGDEGTTFLWFLRGLFDHARDRSEDSSNYNMQISSVWDCPLTWDMKVSLTLSLGLLVSHSL